MNTRTGENQGYRTPSPLAVVTGYLSTPL